MFDPYCSRLSPVVLLKNSNFYIIRKNNKQLLKSLENFRRLQSGKPFKHYEKPFKPFNHSKTI